MEMSLKENSNPLFLEDFSVWKKLVTDRNILLSPEVSACPSIPIHLKVGFVSSLPIFIFLKIPRQKTLQENIWKRFYEKGHCVS